MTAKPPNGVAAIVVNYNAAEHIGACLRSIGANGISDVVVVDNGSTDGSQAVVESHGACWLPAGSNFGYGRAANIGAGSSLAVSAEYLLVCNPDVELFPGCLTKLVETLEADASLGIVGPAIINPDGSLYPSARTFPDLVDAVGHGLLGSVAPDNRFTRKYRLLDWDHGSLARVDWVSGACFAVKRKVWEAVGGFDPAYFMYLEDVDLCWRVGHAGWGVAYQPSARSLHVQGVSADLHPYRMLAAHHRSMWRFAVRSTPGSKRAFLPAVGLGLVGRLGVVSLLHRFGRPPGGLTPPATGDPAAGPLP